MPQKVNEELTNEQKSRAFKEAQKRLALERCSRKAYEDLALTEKVSQQMLVKLLMQIKAEQYNDVIEDRSAENICGLPTCGNELPQTKKQKFGIVNNRVYDLDERKKFCSSKCFSVSNLLKKQIPDAPLWARRQCKPIVYPGEEASVDHGEEVVFRHRLEKKDIEELVEEESDFEFYRSKDDYAEVSTSESKLSLVYLEDLPAKNKKKPSANYSLTSCYKLLEEWICSKSIEFLTSKNISHDTKSVTDGSTSESLEEEEEKDKKMNNLMVSKANKTHKKLDSVPDINDLMKSNCLDKLSEFMGKKLQIKETEKLKEDKKTKKLEESKKIVLPTIDSQDQDIIRRKILFQNLFDKMKQVKEITFPVVFTDYMKQLISTLKLNSKNVYVQGKDREVILFLFAFLLGKISEDIQEFTQSDDFNAKLQEFGMIKDQVMKRLESMVEL